MQEYFPHQDVVESARKAKRGLGMDIKGSPLKRSKLIKMYLTGKYGPGRMIFLVLIDERWYIPVLLRLKTDKVGSNMMIKNPAFHHDLDRNIDLIQEDIDNGHYRKIPLDERRGYYSVCDK